MPPRIGRRRFLSHVLLPAFSLWARPLAGSQTGAPSGIPIITLYTPEPQEFELALDEAQLEWMNAGTGKQALASAAVPVAGTRLVRRQGTRATFALSNISTTSDLVARVKALEAANPGSEGELVLYDRGSVHSDATRHVLTREVGVVLADASDPDGVLTRFATSLPRVASGVPGGYVITADDPLSAMALADVLRQQPSVKTATPLMRQVQFLR